MTRTAERTNFLASIVVTAIEGGINYWADTKEYRLTWAHQQLTQATALIRDWEAPDGDWAKIDVDTIARGIGKVLEAEFSLNKEMKDWIRNGTSENDSGNIDCWCADAIVQAAVLGELVYG